MRRYKKQKYLAPGLFAALLVAVVYWAWPSSPAPAKSTMPADSTAASMATPQFNKSQYPIDTAASLWAVVNKGRSLPSGYVPANLVAPNVPLRLASSSPEMRLRAEAATAMEAMFAAAKRNGLGLMLTSGYRSYSNQAATYAGFVKSYGVVQADTFSARPGHSEHQSGLAADIEPVGRTCELDQCFANTPEGKWLAANSYKYGFIIRYYKGSDALTGYEYEPWHIRFVGTELAARLRQSGQTLEQFFRLPIYLNYPAQGFLLK